MIQLEMTKTFSAIETKFLNPGFEYWFTNHEHVRTPFPKSISLQVKENTRNIFFDWIKGLKKSELENMLDAEFAEMFETILFNEAMKLVEDEDLRLTISYPFMPRVGDLVKHKEHGDGKIIERNITITKDNKKMLEVLVSSNNDSAIWKTQFELTA